MSEKATTMSEKASPEKAGPVKLSEEEKLRMVVRILFHQVKVNLDGFEAGTGQSKIAIQRLLERLKKQYVTDNPSGPLPTTEPTTPTPKKRGRGKKEPTEEDDAPSTKKRGSQLKKSIKAEEMVDQDDGVN